MNRRVFMLGGAAIAALPQVARAEVRCSPYDWNGVQLCEAGIPSIRVIPARQSCEQWCWAACVQMILALKGRDVAQEQIVERLYGDQRCSPANGPQIVAAVNAGPLYERSGRRFTAYAYPLLDFSFGVGNLNAAAAAAQHLAAGNPLINGAIGHATVLTAITFYRDINGNGQVQSVIVRDPWPGNPSRRMLTPQEVSGTNLLIAID